MGRLIDRERRTRAKQAKKERMRAIREEANRSFLKLPYFEVTLDAIGRRAGVKKGVASMYFGTKEELFLEMLRGELDGWYRELLEKLRERPARLSGRQLARLVASGLAERQLATRLLALAPVVLEQNMEIMEADRFHRWQRERMIEVGGEIERRALGLAEGRGVGLLHRIQLVAASVHAYAYPRGSLAFNLYDPDFEDFKLDMGRELESAVHCLLDRDDS
jgi:AcrR family transcriptional regulator